MAKMTPEEHERTRDVVFEAVLPALTLLALVGLLLVCGLLLRALDRLRLTP